MSSKKEIKEILVCSLAECLDEFLYGFGFQRRKNSVNYIRKMNEMVQEISFLFHYKPRYQPGADAHIYPMLKLSEPKVCKVALDMVAGQKLLLANAPEIIVNQPIEITAPKEYHVRWFATNPTEFDQKIIEIRSFIERWAVPFLQDYSGLKGITDSYDSNDERVLRQQHWYIFVAASYVLMGKIAEATKVIEEKFGKPGLRSRYGCLFEFLESKKG
jgi:hypothetical protein